MKHDNTEDDCEQETAARDGLMKMKTVYEANPALGDPMSIQVSIIANKNTIDYIFVSRAN